LKERKGYGLWITFLHELKLERVSAGARYAISVECKSESSIFESKWPPPLLYTTTSLTASPSPIVKIRRFYGSMDGQQEHHPDVHSSEKTALILLLVSADPLKPFSVDIPSYPLLQPPKVEEDSDSELEPADPDFYRIGYARSMRAYGIEFKEGPDGFGVYAAKDVEPLRRARVVMEIPIELMLNISKKLPWMFFPDIIPLGHPIFDIINSTDPETDWDLRLACLLLFAFDCEDNFWQLYGDFLPSADECPSLLLATEEDLLELQDENLASTVRKQQLRALEFWEKNWHSGAPLKIKRLARDPEKFIWAVSMAQSRCINMQIRVGALTQDTNMLIPYADMLNHSFEPNCFFHWRFKDRMLEVMINAGQQIRKGEEMTVNYMNGQKNDMFMQRYGFSSPVNPWDVIQFSGNARIHLDSFLSVFNISGLPEEYCHNSLLSKEGDPFVDGAVIAAARTLPTWSDGDLPPVPSIERKAVKELQEECQKMLAQFPTTSKKDLKILDSMPEATRTLEAAIKYRLHRKLLIEKVVQALGMYQERILF
ncbi:putative METHYLTRANSFERASE, partial [Salix viminalis]